jgi:malonyl-CoA O-methyltransferase
MIGSPTLDSRQAYALWASSYPAKAHNPVMMAEERAMLALLPEDLSGMRVLDAGCGSGRYLQHARSRGADDLVGVDLSSSMLARVAEVFACEAHVSPRLVEGDVRSLPLADDAADLAICGLVLGHLPSLRDALAELRRVTRPGGAIVCSDVHPIGPALGWQRDFKAAGRRYAVEHTQHLYADWHAACRSLGLAIEAVREPYLDPADIAPEARFDPVALRVPVALVFRLRRHARGEDSSA